MQRGERLLEKLVSNGTLSPSGRDFVLACVDPMHDTRLEHLEGWPDLETSNSVVRKLQQTVTLKYPGPVEDGTSWTAHVVSMPLLNLRETSHFTCSGNYCQWDATQVIFGGVMVWFTQAGEPVNYATSPVIARVAIDPEYLQGAVRLVGQGIEVVNTTADLYKQGSCIVYRNNQAHHQESVYYQKFDNGVDDPYAVPFSGAPVAPQPLSEAEAMLIPGSRQWRAADGCYLVTAFVGQDNPPLQPAPTQPIFLQTPPVIQLSNDPENWISWEGFLPKYVNVINTDQAMPVFDFNYIAPIHQAGAIFSGLSPQTTLTLTVNNYLESFPGPRQKDILVLATPSAEYDPMALEIISHAMRTLPVGVIAADNSFGEWFADVVSTVSKWATPTLRMIHPVAGALSEMAGRAANTYLAAQSPQSKPMLQSKPTPKQAKKVTQQVIVRKTEKARSKAKKQRNLRG